MSNHIFTSDGSVSRAIGETAKRRYLIEKAVCKANPYPGRGVGERELWAAVAALLEAEKE